MREFVGHKVRFEIEGMGNVEGVVINDAKDRVFVKRDDTDKITRIIKSHVCAFTPLDFEPEDYVPFHVLHCWNRKKGCPGVRFVLAGAGFKQSDFETFMEPCPCREEGCGRGTKGELRSVAGTFLKEMFADTIYGDYPEKKEAKESGGRSGKTNGEAECGEGEGTGTDSGEESDNGGAGRPEEASGGAGEASQG